MNANLKLLAKDYPRSPRETLAGYVIAARMLDKCRAVGEATVNQAVAVGHLNNQSSRTRNLKLFDRDKSEVREIINRSPDLGKNCTRIFRVPRPTSFMPCGISLRPRVEDVLSRRLRALPLNAQASKNRHGPARRQIRAVGELDRDAAWQTKQVAAFRELAAGYLP